MKLNELLHECIKKLNNNKIDDSIIKAKIVIEYELKIPMEKFILHKDDEISKEDFRKIDEDIELIVKGKPIQYITHNQCFFGLDFYVDENVLIPQPDTEVLVEEVLKIAKNNFGNIKILDMCTGSGAIAVSISKFAFNCEIYASDISLNALKIAHKNAESNNAKIKFIESDCFEKINEKFDIIVSNPPYIETETIKGLPIEVQNEPKIALDGGQDGLDFYRILAENAKKYLNDNGILAVEIGYNQKDNVIQIFKKNGLREIYSRKDYGKNDRIVVGKI